MEQKNPEMGKEAAAPQTGMHPPLKNKDMPLYGVKGWLLFFMLPMMLLGVAFLFNLGFALSAGFSKFSSDAAGAWGVLGTAMLMYAPLIAVIVVTLTLLFRGDIRFRYWYIAYAALTLINGVLPALRDPAHSTGYLVYPAFVVAGCLYLFRADRVRVTCGLPPLREHMDPGEPKPYPKLAMPIRDHREDAYAFPEAKQESAAMENGTEKQDEGR